MVDDDDLVHDDDSFDDSSYEASFGRRSIFVLMLGERPPTPQCVVIGNIHIHGERCRILPVFINNCHLHYLLCFWPTATTDAIKCQSANINCYSKVLTHHQPGFQQFLRSWGLVPVATTWYIYQFGWGIWTICAPLMGYPLAHRSLARGPPNSRDRQCALRVDI